MKKFADQILHDQREKILDRWQKRAYQEVAASLHQTSLALKNSMLDFLIQIEGELKNIRDIKPDSAASPEFGLGHGVIRASTVNYSIDQVIYEYHILREVLFTILEEEKALSVQERNLILSMIEQAANHSATSFSDTLRQIREGFISALTHDLRTPVTSSMMSAEMIIRKSEDKDYCIKASNTIIKNMIRLDKMINELLDASRLGAGEKLELKFSMIDLNHIISQIITSSQLQFGTRFVFHSSGPVSGVWSEEGLKRVVENILSNAIKYSFPKTPIVITLTQDETFAWIKIQNQGEPITPENQKIIFQQYRRIPNTQNQRGWGLGLLVVKGIVEAHEGNIFLESSQEQGTIFTVKIPFKRRPLLNI